MADSAQKPAIEHRAPSDLRPYGRNARTHSKSQVRQIAESIKRFGFTNPVLISDEDEIIAGHGRVEAAKLLGIATVPTLRLSHLNETERRAYVLADNKLALNAGWDPDLLSIELQALINLDFDVSLTGFSTAEIDLTLDAARDRDPAAPPAVEDEIPAMGSVAICRPGEVWRLGRHRLACGDAQDPAIYQALMQDDRADLVFTDPPYNVPIDGHVCGQGRVRHREFAMGAGEMSKTAFTEFLTRSLGAMAGVSRDGAIAFVCMDWRHMGELIAAGESVFAELKNLCVWNKTNGGMGTFYRSKHELVFVYKVGSGAHTNTFGLGDTGRYRTNVWDYAGISSLTSTRSEELAMHPTVKPTALVADAIRDCTQRNQIVLDGFGGSGTTLIAAEATGRRARLIEYDPLYCDVILRRYQRLTGKAGVLDGTGQAFDVLETERDVECAA